MIWSLVAIVAESGENPIPKCETGFIDLQSYLLSAIPELAGLKDEANEPSLNGRASFGQVS